MNRLPTCAELQAGATPAPPSLERLEQVVTLREGRLRRAFEKHEAARDEKIAALIALCHARAARTAFIAGQTDPQLRMF